MKTNHRIIYVDIDETICTTPESRKYEDAVPIQENINKINNLYEEGHTIVYWTARGSRTQKDWSELTRKQLNSWGAKFHELNTKKPYYDMFIDDKNFRIEEI
jgi:histidinol phosphatase-like enzyme